jgi:tetratricopeptide (TPR) repeat protein
LGESLATVEKFNVSLEQATTSSLEALKVYSEGRRTAQEKGFLQAIPFFERAIQLDSNFAMAYGILANSYSNLGEPSLARLHAKKAYELRDRVTEPERLRLEGLYYDNVTGELEKEIEVYERWVQSYPKDSKPIANLGFLYEEVGQYEKALAQDLEVIRLRSAEYYGYYNAATAYLALERVKEARTIYEKALAAKVEAPDLQGCRYLIAFAEGDRAEMDRLVTSGTGAPDVDEQLLQMQVLTKAYFGRIRNARELTQGLVAAARRRDEKDYAVSRELVMAGIEAEVGYTENARRRVLAVLKDGAAPEIQISAASILARDGDSARAQTITDQLAE